MDSPRLTTSEISDIQTRKSIFYLAQKFWAIYEHPLDESSYLGHLEVHLSVEWQIELTLETQL